MARYLFKLMAYKDEYEVARLYTDGTFQQADRLDLRGRASCGSNSISRRPCSRKTDKATGELKKMSFGPWMLTAFGVLKHFKFLRGTPLDPFGYSAERRTERKLIARLRGLARRDHEPADADNHAVAVGLAAIPEKIRGFGHVKARHLMAAKADEAALLEQLRSGAGADAEGGRIAASSLLAPLERRLAVAVILVHASTPSQVPGLDAP